MFKIQLFPLENYVIPLFQSKIMTIYSFREKKLLTSDKGNRYSIIPRLKRPH